MEFVATLLVFLWVPFVIALHIFLPPQRATLLAYVAGWLWLPLIQFDFPGIPAYGKFTATSCAVLPCLFLFGFDRLARIRPSWIDLPMLLWLFAPLPSSLSNGLGLLDGLSGVSNHLLEFAVPYLAGRVYLRESEDWLFLSRVLVGSALAYMPLCVYEMRMSPVLHELVFGQVGRPSYESNPAFGVLQWAPTVFMNSAFEVAMLMVAAALVCYTSSRYRETHRILLLNPTTALVICITFVVLCKKWSGMAMLACGLSTLIASEIIRTRAWALTLVLIPILYTISFSLGIWRLEGVSHYIAKFSPRRAQSLQFRLDNDTLLVEKAMERSIFGWGGWGRNRIYDEEGRDISVTDSAYGINIGMFGLWGLTAITLFYALPFCVYVIRHPPDRWLESPDYLIAPFAIVIALHALDNLFNAFPGVLYPLLAGGICTRAKCTNQHITDPSQCNPEATTPPP